MQIVDSEIRKHIHLAAVFASNFSNAMWSIADDYLRKNTPYTLSLLEPLVYESVRKAMKLGPNKSQTGPARRNDHKTIDAHLQLLPSNLQNIYKVITNHII